MLRQCIIILHIIGYTCKIILHLHGRYCIHYLSLMKNCTDDKFMHPPLCHQSLISLHSPVNKCVLSPNQLIVWKSKLLVPFMYSPFTISSSSCIHILEPTVPDIKEIVPHMLWRGPIICRKQIKMTQEFF